VKKLLFLYKTPRWNVYKNWERGKGPDTILYGANHLKKLGYKVDFYDFTFSKFNPARWIFYPIFLLIRKASGLGFKMDQALCLLPIVNSYDCIISTIDTAGLPFLFLKKLKLIKKPVIYCSMDFAHRLINKKNPLFNFYKSLLPEASLIVCYSKEEMEILKKYNKKVVLLKVGTDTNYYKDVRGDKKINSKVKILAFGRDSSRDYKALIDAMEGEKDKEVTIVCSRENLNRITVPDNINIEIDLTAAKLKEEIAKSDIVVIPTLKVGRAAGQLSMLDSFASSKPTIISNIESLLKTYDLKPSRDCIIYEPGNAKDLKYKIEKLSSSPKVMAKLSANGRLIAQKNSTFLFAKNLAKLVETF